MLVGRAASATNAASVFAADGLNRSARNHNIIHNRAIRPANARALTPTFGINVSAGNGDGAVGQGKLIVSGANAGTAVIAGAAIRAHSSALYADVVERPVEARPDTRAAAAAMCFNLGGSFDGYAGCIILARSAANTRSVRASVGDYFSTFEHHVARVGF